MCIIQKHTCVCHYGDKAKVLLVRRVRCAIIGRDCPNPKVVVVEKCVDFHTEAIAARARSYDCAVCSVKNPDTGAVDEDEAFASIGKDGLTEFHHLDKQRQSGRTYFLNREYRTGYVDPKEEYTAELYHTGNHFRLAGEEDSGMVEFDMLEEEERRYVEHFDDPTPKLYLPSGERDTQGEYQDFRKWEHPTDTRYRVNQDLGLPIEATRPGYRHAPGIKYPYYFPPGTHGQRQNPIRLSSSDEDLK